MNARNSSGAAAQADSNRDSTSRLAALHRYGQAPWLDFLSRTFIADGSLKKLVEEDGLTGVTSNPSIFEKSIGGGSDYDASLERIEKKGDLDVMSLYEHLAIADIQAAADVLRPVFERTRGADGYVSLEVSPYLANDTEATIAEAKRLRRAVGRDNVMIKVPATKAGLPAIRRLIGEGLSINVTLLFAQGMYEQVVDSYLAGLEDLSARGGDPRTIASVASVFVSRIDVAVDKLIDQKVKQESSAGKRVELAELRGKAAIANAKLCYQHYKRLFSGSRWDKLKAQGAREQRLLWASTATKHKDYSDVLYVDELIGPDTVNTLPPATLDAFRDHGTLHNGLETGLSDANRAMEALDRYDISIDQVTTKLVEEGVQLFSDSFDKLLGAVASKRRSMVGEKLNSQTSTLPSAIEQAVKDLLEKWRSEGNIRRFWAGDAKLWTGGDESKWVDWLTIVEEQQKRVGELEKLAEDIHKEGFSHILLLGMGGSSLGPEVLARTFGGQASGPELLILDSTDPAQVRAIEKSIDPARTLFIVSSKSGGTLEPNVLKEYFFEIVKGVIGSANAGTRFIAITDPGSSLETQAKADGFQRILHGKANIGGRYSVLSDFGMAPAAAIGLDLKRLLDATAIMVRSCDAHVPPAENPGVILGATLAAAAKAGHDKVTVIASPGIADFGAWLEQLLAESTGKNGKGLIPVDAEPLGDPSVYSKDRLFAYLKLSSEADAAQDQAVKVFEQAGHPVVRIDIADRYQIGQEFFRWEIATAVAGAVLGIDPFDQPDVEASKVQTKELVSAYEKCGSLPAEKAFFAEGGLSLFGDQHGGAASQTLADHLSLHFKLIGPGDYVALLAYIERNGVHREALQGIRRIIRDQTRAATCVGFGPRFLHSTGQAYKGGPNTGVFFQITCDDAADLQIPGRKYSFGVVKAAQARGDLEVLNQRKRRVLRVHLGSDVARGLAKLEKALRQALA